MNVCHKDSKEALHTVSSTPGYCSQAPVNTSFKVVDGTNITYIEIHKRKCHKICSEVTDSWEHKYVIIITVQKLRKIMLKFLEISTYYHTQSPQLSLGERSSPFQNSLNSFKRKIVKAQGQTEFLQQYTVPKTVCFHSPWSVETDLCQWI